MLSPTQVHALAQAAASSVAGERATRLPAELSLAQWALETGWGQDQPGNNCFGIKAYPGCYGVQSLQTVEVVHGKRVNVIEEFATFPNLESCFAKHAELLTVTNTYGLAWSQYLQNKDLERLIRQIGLLYSTDPNYAAHLLRILAMPQVKQALAESRAAALNSA